MESQEYYIKVGYGRALTEVKDEVNGLINALRARCNPNPFGNTEECLADAEIQAFDLVLDIIKEKLG